MSRREEFDLPEDRRFARDRSELIEDQDDWFDHGDGPDADEGQSLTRHWGWLLVLGLAWLLFELSVDPAVSVMVASIGLGWNHFFLALWLLRRDRDRRRGVACAAFYLAAGFWRITAVTFVLIFLATLISLTFDFRHGRKDDIVTGVAASIIGMGFILSGLTTSTAVVLARRRKLKIWLDPEIRLARRRRQWPPRSLGPNRIGGVIKSTACLIALVELVLGYGSTAWLMLQQKNGAGPVWMAVLTGIMVFVPIIAAAATILGGPEWAIRNLKAEAPQECWPDEPPPEEPHSDPTKL